jgi:protein-serine/threonine kinase
MSSAALQAAPRQPTSLSSPIQSPSSRQYTSSHSSPTNEAYHAQQSNTASPVSRRPPSRKASGNDPSPSLELNPRSLMYQAPTPPSEQHSPIAARFSDMPPVAPPRTSSTQHGGASRRGNPSSDRAAQSSRQPPADQTRSASHADPNGVENSRTKRPITTHLPTESAGRSPQSRDPRPAETTLPIRASHQPTSSRPPREISENVVRAASEAEDANGRTVKKEYQGSPTQDDERAAASPVVPTGQEDRRGGRSRHEHLRAHRGTSKFGDFILGNTIGEGEFGKVKLGWKQDNTSVQVWQHCFLGC